MIVNKRKIRPHKGGRDYRPPIRVTRKEWEQIKLAAKEYGLSVPDWIMLQVIMQCSGAERLSNPKPL